MILELANGRAEVQYPLAAASDDLKQKFGGIEGLPATMLYDGQGMLRKKLLGLNTRKHSKQI